MGAVGALVSLLLVILYLPETKDYEKLRRYVRLGRGDEEQYTRGTWLHSSLCGGGRGDIRASPSRQHAASKRTWPRMHLFTENMVGKPHARCPLVNIPRSSGGSSLLGDEGSSPAGSLTDSPLKTGTAADAERSSYQQLLEGTDIYGHEEGGEDGAAVEAAVLPRYPHLGHDFDAAEKSEVDRRSTSSSGGGATDELSATSDEGGEKDGDAGILGPNGLLAVPHVGLVLVLAVLISVRRRRRD